MPDGVTDMCTHSENIQGWQWVEEQPIFHACRQRECGPPLARAGILGYYNWSYKNTIKSKNIL
jgi:hypothetical protein